MNATDFYFSAQATAVSVFVGLAAYIGACRTSRPIHKPFVAFALAQAWMAYSILLLRAPGGYAPHDIPLPLRMRWAMGAFIVPLFLHMGLYLLEVRRRQPYWWAVVVTYALAAASAGAALAGAPIFTGVRMRGPAAGDTIGPALTHLGRAAVIGWASLGILSPVPLLAHAQRPKNPRLHADTLRLLWPWTGFLLAWAMALLALSYDAARPDLAFALGTARILLAIGAGAWMAAGVLRFGSPAGQPLHPQMAPAAVLAAVSLLSLNALAFHQSSEGNQIMQLIVPPVAGLVAGLLLARPEIARPWQRTADAAHPEHASFAARLRAGWRALAGGGLDDQAQLQLLRALQDETTALFVEVLQRAESPEDQHLVYRHPERGWELALDPEAVEWPIAERAIARGRLERSRLPGPVNLILPMGGTHPPSAVLAVGEPVRGGLYNQADLANLEQACALLGAAQGLAAAREAGPGRRIAEARLGVGSPRPKVLIRAFGRLRLVSPGARAAPLRARQVLAYLLTAYPEPVAAGELIDRMWPEISPRSASNNLHVAVHALRSVLEPSLARAADSRYILREGNAYRLAVDQELWIDVVHFREAYEAGVHHMEEEDSQSALEAFEAALELYRGTFLDDPSLDLSAEVEVYRHRLRREFHEMLEFVVEAFAEEGRSQDVERLLLQAVEVEPWDWQAVRRLTDLYLLQGRLRAAQRLRARFRRLLDHRE